MATSRPDRGIRRRQLALLAAAAAFLGMGLLSGTWWLTGIGVWAGMAAVALGFVHSP
ncbi:hypothetical protein [Streptomyces poriticola]|uniref:hypothetical protein n=1 Tax=Streptomyces poriticola TaxID=3120506 RepID=UPI002FCE0727